MNYGSGTFASRSTDWCKEQYNTGKVLLDAVAKLVVRVGVKEWLAVAESLPGAQEEFAELYDAQRLQLKIGNAVV